MDADDIALPERFRKQVAFLDANPRVAVCGCHVRTFGALPDQEWKFPTGSDEIYASLLFSCVLCHPSVMMRKEALEQAGLNYRPGYERAEDFDFWSRTARLYSLANLPEVLLLYRTHAAQVSVKHRGEQVAVCGRIVREQLEYFGVQADADEFQRICCYWTNKPR